MRPVSDISGLRKRLLPKTVAVSVQRRMGWYVLQPGPELLHQPRTLQKWRHVLQHGTGPVHVRMRPRIYGARVQRRHGTDQQTRNGLFHWTDVPQRRYVQGERRIIFIALLPHNLSTCIGRGWVKRAKMLNQQNTR